MRDWGLDPGSPQWAPDPYAEVDSTRVSRRREHTRRANELDKRLASPTAPDPLNLPEHYADIMWREHVSRCWGEEPKVREWSRLREAEGSTPEGLLRGAAPARWDAERWPRSRVPGKRFVQVLRDDDVAAPVDEDENAPEVDIVNSDRLYALGNFDHFFTPIPSAREEGEDYVPPPWEVTLTPREAEGAGNDEDPDDDERPAANATEDDGPPDWYDKVVVDRARLSRGVRFESKGETREEAVARRLRGHPTPEEVRQDKRRDKSRAMKELKEVRHALGMSNRVVGEKDDDTRAKEKGRKY